MFLNIEFLDLAEKYDLFFKLKSSKFGQDSLDIKDSLA